MVTLIVKDRDDYGRWISVVILPDGRTLNQELVRAGYAWWYRHYAPDDMPLAELESEAREAKRGLWAVRRPVPPWIWRRQIR
jgi:endonuclease YncB( thermonuclease family)